MIALAAMFVGVRLMRPGNGSAWTSPAYSGHWPLPTGHAWATISVERDGVKVLDLEAVESRMVKSWSSWVLRAQENQPCSGPWRATTSMACRSNGAQEASVAWPKTP